jgi:thioredoxin reductase/ferredoxin
LTYLAITGIGGSVEGERSVNVSGIPVTTVFIYLAPFILVIFLVARRKRTRELADSALLDSNIRSGLMEPASLHPWIDVAKCIGCGSCAAACPEARVIGIINGKASLVNPTYCIGHGACRSACPMNAITLVFGTEKRGVDIPHVQPNYETNVPGIYISGELGGMGLIRNAIEQGKQAVASIRKMKGMKRGDGIDLVIVGSGPSGIAASLAAKEGGLRFVTLEQESLGGTVAHFPRGKVVMTAPVELPMVGKVKITETTKEALLELWERVVQETKLEINYHERVDEINATADGFCVKTSKGEYQTRAVLLAIGRRGTPRKLGVKGEEMDKVVYRLIDSEQYQGQHVLVVGGGDSALEAACTIAEEPGVTVTVSYRSASFNRAKEKNRDRILAASDQGKIRVLFSSNVREISQDSVTLEQEGSTVVIDNDAVIVSAGGILPTAFLKQTGIEVETKHGTA